MRSDIDILIPKKYINDFYLLSKSRGFNKYVFSDDEIFIADSDIESEFTKDYWLDKDFAITMPYEIEPPSVLPIDFGDCYLPWLYRNNKWHLMVSVEVHHHYTLPSDEQIIIDNSEVWPETTFKRCNLSSLIFFNIIRLYKGVLAGEKRLRLLLDTACLIVNIKNRDVFYHLDVLIQSSPLCIELQSICYELSQLHQLFSPLNYLSRLNNSSLVGKEWNERFYDSLKLDF